MKDLEARACQGHRVDLAHFNDRARLPYGCTVEHVCAAMNEFVDFISFVNEQLRTRDIPRLEAMLMPANFSSMVGEFIVGALPRHCEGLVRNRYHNGHPDLLPSGRFPDDAVQHSREGIEVKASRYSKGWQGHNPEDTWLMVLVFDSNRPADVAKGAPPRPFRFLQALAARLTKKDWSFAGRSETSRRTITASVTQRGYEKMAANWIYRAPESE